MDAASRLAARLTAAGAVTRPVLCIDREPSLMIPPLRGRISRVVGRARGAGAAPLVDLAVAAGAGRALWDEPSETWVVIPAESGLPSRRYLALRVGGDSMTPLLHSGDVVLVDLEGDVAPGAVVVARQPDDRGEGGYVVKRVGGMSPASLELTSINPEYPPLTIPSDRRHVVGTVVLRWCAHAREPMPDPSLRP
jgi:phage repressor protein C with HTH and peptisase S24 domain